MKTTKDFPINVIRGLPPVLTSKDKVAVDMELWGMDGKRLHRPVKLDGSPNGTFASTQLCFNGVDVYMVEGEDDVAQALENIKDALWIFANMDFDITHLRRYANIPDRKKMWDVITIERILYSGYYASFGLKDLVRRYLHTYIDKDVRKEFSEGIGWTKESREYAAYDALFTWHVAMEQAKVVTKTDMKIWREVDLPAVWTLLSMDGFPVDVDKWNEAAEEITKVREDLQNEYPDLNLNSAKQVAEVLLDMGYDLPVTDKGNHQVNGAVLEKLPNPNKFVQNLITYSKTKSLATTFGTKYMDKYVEADGKIHPSFRVVGASSGRLACNSPNLQQIPNKYKDPRYRDSFIAGDGYVLVVGDWSSQEPRVTAYLTKDENMINLFVEDKDIYCGSYEIMYGEPLFKSDPRRNSRMKPIVLGTSYGLTPWGMKNQYDIPVEEGKQMQADFFKAFPNVKQWIDEMRDGREVVTTILGRKYWANPYDRMSKNNVINSPIQGSSADMAKIAGTRFVQEWGSNPIVNFVHDEIVIRVPEEDAERASYLLNKVMVEVAEEMHPSVPGKADVGVGATWNAKQ